MAFPGGGSKSVQTRARSAPGDDDAGFDLPALAAEGRALNNDRRIDRQAVWKLKKTALEHLWSRFSASGGDPAFEAFRAEHGETLKDFATHCAMTERFPGPWPEWPEEYRRPDPRLAPYRPKRCVTAL